MRYARFFRWKRGLGLSLALVTILVQGAAARVYEIRPAIATTDEEFEKVANALRPGDELVLHGGTYSQTDRRAVAVKGTAERPIVIRAAAGESPLLTHPSDGRDRQNNIEFVNCSHLVVR